MTGERALHDQFSAWLRKQGLPFAHSQMHKATRQESSDPDYAVFKDSRVAFVEFKMPGNKLKHQRNERQKARFDELANAGCTVRICFGIETAIAHVQTELLDGGDVKCHGLKTTQTSITQRGSNGSAKFKPEAEPKFYVAGSRDCGDLVISRDLTGKWGAHRVASASDKERFPRFAGVWE